MPALYIGFKEGVRCTIGGLRRMQVPFGVLLDTAPPLHEDTVYVTSMCDSFDTHISELTMHAANAAWDIRTHPAPTGEPRVGSILEADIDQAAKVWIERSRKLLGPGWQFLYEPQKKHIHLEFDYGK